MYYEELSVCENKYLSKTGGSNRRGRPLEKWKVRINTRGVTRIFSKGGQIV